MALKVGSLFLKLLQPGVWLILLIPKSLQLTFELLHLRARWSISTATANTTLRPAGLFGLWRWWSTGLSVIFHPKLTFGACETGRCIQAGGSPSAIFAAFIGADHILQTCLVLEELLLLRLNGLQQVLLAGAAPEIHPKLLHEDTERLFNVSADSPGEGREDAGGLCCPRSPTPVPPSCPRRMQGGGAGWQKRHRVPGTEDGGGPTLEAGRCQHKRNSLPGIARRVSEAAQRFPLVRARAARDSPRPTVRQGFKLSETTRKLLNYSGPTRALPGPLEVTTARRLRLRPQWARGGWGYFSEWVLGGLLRTKLGASLSLSGEQNAVWGTHS
ncbi:uncharacterized protein LOC120601055 [Pteropus medius]|uniref:uncharacterized protein LOC120601055 n=1 Tax=Pteropus vampyrus TaxID=132908 RepID=UPI00196B027D|nr:uncharacterized protein LOC120601055 [Pteropus giganteus]